MHVQNENRKIYADHNIRLTKFVLYMVSFIKHGLPFLLKSPLMASNLT